MIFKQIDEILSGRKTETRRVVKPDEISILRVKWEVGRTYAVVPKRGLPAVWWCMYNDYGHKTPIYRADVKKAHLDSYRNIGWRQLRIRITAIRQERLQDISEADARAEGVADVAAYRALWEKINTRKGTRWTDNPMVFVLGFELVRREHNA